MQSEVPDGMWRDAKGRLVPEDLVKPIDQHRDSVVRDLVRAAKHLAEQLAAHKQWMSGELEAFVQLSAEQYGVHVGGRRGNLTLQSFDGLMKVQRQIQDRISFDERIQTAKTLIDECLREWSRDGDPKIRRIVEDAFQVDRQGKISVERVLNLRRVDIQDPKWQEAMRALTDSIQVDSTTSYIRVYERDTVEEPWRPVLLDFSSIGGGA